MSDTLEAGSSLDKDLQLISSICNVQIVSSTFEQTIVSFYYSLYSFELYIEADYPSSSPLLTCSSMLEFPSISDGRDLLPLIFDWDSSKSLIDIINSMPKFLENFDPTQDIGEFKLLSSLPYHIWDNKPNMCWFHCLEIDPLNCNTLHARVICITHNYFLLLEPSPTKGTLIFWASLFSLKSINKPKFSPDLLVLEWEDSGTIFFQEFKTNQSKLLINTISENLNKLGSIVQNTYQLGIEEYTDKFKVYDILRKIERSERLIETLVDDEKINGLIALYQKAVEFFSGISDCRYEIYLNKLHSLFTDKRVLKIICSEIQPKRSKRNRIRSMELMVDREEGVKNGRRSMEMAPFSE